MNKYLPVVFFFMTKRRRLSVATPKPRNLPSASSLISTAATAAVAAYLGGGNNANIQGPMNSHNAAGNALTQYHDIDRAYYKTKRKRLSKKAKKKKRKYKKWTKRVKRAVSGGSPTFHYNERATAALTMGVMPTVWATSPSQQTLGTGSNGLSGLRLWEGYPLNGVNYSGAAASGVGKYVYNAISLINTRYNSTDVTPGVASVLETVYAYIKHSQTDFTMVNTSGAAINVDVYEFIAVRDIGVNDYYATPLTAMSRIASNDAAKLTNGMTNTIAMTDFGATPWDFPGLSKSWKVMSKTSIYLPVGGQTNLSYKGPKGLWGGTKYQEMTAIKGKTRDYLFVVGSRIGSGMDGVTNPLKVYWNKTYKLKPPVGHTWTTEGIYSAQAYAY